MDARHALCKKILLLKVSSTRNCCNITQFLVFHTIRAKLANQFIQFTHPLPHNDTLHVFIFFFHCGNIKIP